MGSDVERGAKGLAAPSGGFGLCHRRGFCSAGGKGGGLVIEGCEKGGGGGGRAVYIPSPISHSGP